MKKLLYCLLIFALGFGCNGQTTVTMPTLRGGSLAKFNESNVPGGYALIHTSDTTYAYYRQLPNGDLTPAGPTVIYKADGTHWRRLTAIGGTITSWLSISDKPTLYTSPAALRDALASLSGTNRLAYSAIKDVPTFAATFPLTLTTSGTLNTFALNYTNLYSTIDSRYLRTSGGSVSGLSVFSQLTVSAIMSAPKYQLSESEFIDQFTTQRRWRSSTGEYNLLLGNNTNPVNYYRNTTHILQNSSGGTEYLRVGVNSGFNNTSPTRTLDVGGTFGSTGETVLATSSGNVGIGTASPGSKLEVAGDLKISSGGLMVGAGALTGYNVRISKNIAGASSSYGIFQDGEVQAITSGSGIVNGARIATGATLTNYYHFRTLELANGGTLTNNYGLQVNNLTYGTNNYGIYNAVTSGAGKWGYYGAGGAAIYNSGALLIGSNTTQNSKVIAEFASTTQVVLPTRMTATQASALSLGAGEEGAFTYVNSTNGTFTVKGWYGWNGSAWEKLNN